MLSLMNERWFSSAAADYIEKKNKMNSMTIVCSDISHNLLNRRVPRDNRRVHRRPVPRCELFGSECEDVSLTELAGGLLLLYAAVLCSCARAR